MPLGAETYGTPTYGEGVLLPVRFPDIFWDISFFTNPTDSPSWVDNAHTEAGKGRIRSFVVARGRSHELDRMEAGTLRITADNRDRWMDPTYADGPYFGYLLPRRRTRLYVIFNGVQYDLLQGFADSFPQSYKNPADAYVDFKATDGFKFFANADLPKSVYALEVLADSPKCWYRLAEKDPPSGTPLNARLTAIESMQTGFDAGYSATPPVALGKTGAIVGDDDTTVMFPGAGDDTGSWTQATLSIPSENALTGTGDFSVEMWFFGDPGFSLYQLNPPSNPLLKAWSLDFTGSLIDNGDGTSTIVRQSFFTITDANGVDYINVEWDHDQTFSASRDGDGFITTPYTDEFDQKWHHVVGVKDGTTGYLYVDGVQVATDTASVTEVQGGATTLEASTSPGFDDADSDPRSVTAGQIAFYESALSAARVLAHYQAGTAPWHGDLTGVRIGRILDAVGWSAADRDLDEGSSTLEFTPLGSQKGNGVLAPLAQTALDELQVTIDSEFGELWMSPDGKVRFRDRLALLSDDRYVTPQAVFGDGPGELPYRDITPTFDDVQIRNEVSITANGGTEQIARDQDSIDSFFKQSYSKTGLLITDNEAADQAGFILGRYKDPQLRVEQMLVMPQRDPARLFPVVLGLEIGDRITIKRRPQGIGDPIVQDCYIEGITHNVDAGHLKWETEYRLSPAIADNGFTLDESELDGSDVLVY